MSHQVHHKYLHTLARLSNPTTYSVGELIQDYRDQMHEAHEHEWSAVVDHLLMEIRACHAVCMASRENYGGRNAAEAIAAVITRLQHYQNTSTLTRAVYRGPREGSV